VPADGASAEQTTSASAIARRWQAIDRLLPPPRASGAGCGVELIVAGDDGQPAATGSCQHWAGTPDSLELTWGAARRFQLMAAVAGPDVGNALDQLLSRWRDHLAVVPGADAADSAAMVNWPSRDIEGVAALVRHGLSPLAVIAARVQDRHPGASADGAAFADAAGRTSPGLRIRRAGPADIDAVVRLGMEVIRYDAYFGGVTERPGTAAALRREAAGLLTGPEPWTWLAERDGLTVGMIAAERPESAGWIAPLAGPAPVAYVSLLGVLPGDRGGGVGAALAGRLHEAADEAGVAVMLLHYAQVNPLSVPFWGRRDYRPLWTCWETRPARSIR
jgi:ribosomal protein S18 acetylase RimI-like enzyme